MTRCVSKIVVVPSGVVEPQEVPLPVQDGFLLSPMVSPRVTTTSPRTGTVTRGLVLSISLSGPPPGGMGLRVDGASTGVVTSPDTSQDFTSVSSLGRVSTVPTTSGGVSRTVVVRVISPSPRPSSVDVSGRVGTPGPSSPRGGVTTAACTRDSRP